MKVQNFLYKALTIRNQIVTGIPYVDAFGICIFPRHLLCRSFDMNTDLIEVKQLHKAIISTSFYEGFDIIQALVDKQEMIGVLNYNSDELRYEFDVYDTRHLDIVCLSYDIRIFKSMKSIGNIYELDNITDIYLNKEQLILAIPEATGSTNILNMES